MHRLLYWENDWQKRKSQLSWPCLCSLILLSQVMDAALIILVLWWWIYTKMCTYNHYVPAIIECSYAHRALANHANSAKLSITGLIPLYSACGNQLTDMQ